MCNEQDMYYRVSGDVKQIEDVIYINKHATCMFSTYFNAFSLKKWQTYTSLDNVGIALDVWGHFLLRLYRADFVNGKPITTCIKTVDMNRQDKTTYVIPFGDTEGDMLFFTLEALASGILYGGYYFTETQAEELRTVDIDLVMCTYKREKYLKNNLALIKQQFFNQSTYKSAKHFKVRIVDNGNTLAAKYVVMPGKIYFYQGIDSGASGGFCRGMMESLRDGKASHILLMDDDVQVQVEAFERTYTYLTLLKKEYEDSFLGGAMFRLDHKNIQHENLAGFAGDHLISLKHNLDMNQFENILYNEEEEQVPGKYAGWWYCCIPVHAISLQNLPMPFFVRMDDIEYSLRNAKHVLSLNGISVWHEAFDKKYSATMENYYMFRNNLVTNIIHDTGDKKMNLKFFLTRFIREIYRYDYSGAELLLDGVDAFLQGPEFFKNVHMEQDLEEHIAKQVRMKPLEEFGAADKLLVEFKQCESNVIEGKIKKFIRAITINGHLLPAIFFKRQGYAEYGYESRSRLYFCKKDVCACNYTKDAAAIFTINRKKCLKLLLRWLLLSWQIIRKYRELQKSYKDHFPDMTCEAFWQNHLKI